MSSNGSEGGRVPRVGRASLRATEAGFGITGSPASRLGLEHVDGGGRGRRDAAASPSPASLSFAETVKRRQASVVACDGDEEEGAEEEEEEESEVEEVAAPKLKRPARGLPPLPPSASNWPPKGTKTWSTGQRTQIMLLGTWALGDGCVKTAVPTAVVVLMYCNLRPTWCVF